MERWEQDESRLGCSLSKENDLQSSGSQKWSEAESEGNLNFPLKSPLVNCYFLTEIMIHTD